MSVCHWAIGIFGEPPSGRVRLRTLATPGTPDAAAGRIYLSQRAVGVHHRDEHRGRVKLTRRHVRSEHIEAGARVGWGAKCIQQAEGRLRASRAKGKASQEAETECHRQPGSSDDKASGTPPGAESGRRSASHWARDERPE